MPGRWRSDIPRTILYGALACIAEKRKDGTESPGKGLSVLCTTEADVSIP
jgi:hypothetical protein